MKTVRLVHGYNVNDGGLDTIGRLINPLKLMDYNPVMFVYGLIGLLSALFWNKKRAKKLKRITQPDDILIGHSNGCTIIARAIEQGLNNQHIIFIHPALDKGWTPPKSFTGTIYVYHSENDMATELASWIPLVMWGDMGGGGATSGHPAFVNYDGGYKHSDGFKKDPDLYIETLK
ncbi:MAG: hypothetical protein KAS32_23440 [Candidatus Peribacteraceae bacterium]|nr:hypothetical protein [Candidatus Peribacteraceae bacterium]